MEGDIGNTGNDAGGTRFVVTRDLLDTIFLVQPEARIGLVVFAEVLYFDQRTHDILVPLEGVPVVRDDQVNQAYIPPLQLNATYNLNDTEMLGIDVIKYFLQTRENRGTVDLVYQPGFEISGYTNINNAFEAALQGNALVPDSVISREQRFIVFLSDGVPNPDRSPADSVNHGNKNPYYFKAGINTPTTSTVYLHASDQVPPDSLVEMTENIRNNGYSKTNPSSKIWILKTNYADLMNLFMQDIVKPILRVQSGFATFMSINNITSVSQADSLFLFNNRFPLKKDTTTFNVKVTYHVTDQTLDSVYDSTTTTNFTVVRQANPGNPSSGILDCWNRDLQLLYNGNPIQAVDASMSDLQVLFSDPDNSYKSVSIQVSSTSNDAFNLNLTKNTRDWDGSFSRTVGDPVITDQILQHQAIDSIILIYRNPDIPLDTIRKAYPFTTKVLNFNSACYFDNNADGYVDSIFIGITGEVAPGDLVPLRTLIHLPEYRSFTVNSISIVDGGLAYLVKDGVLSLQTYVTADDVIRVDNAQLVNGIIAGGTLIIQDKIAPVLISGKLISSALDSLRVVFSEPVKGFISNEPIKFIKPNGTTGYLVITEQTGNLNSTQYTTRVISVQSGNSISQGDLIWINIAARISDTLGNEQLNPQNRKVPIEVQQVPYTIIAKVINNPFSSEEVIPQEIRDVYAGTGIVSPQKGIVIIVEPTDTTKNKINLQGKVSIYDVVKNPVIKDVPGVFDEKTKNFYFAWDGLNSNGRRVSTGTYIGIVNIIDLNKKQEKTSTILLGVKR